MLFTIVIPTRNRPELAEFALRSSLRQDFDDFDVLLSDNSSPEHADRVRQIVDSIGDRRVRYIRPPSEMSMGEHWEWAIPQADGDYIGVLTDRMAFKKDGLSRLAAEIRSHTIDVITYTSSGVREAAAPFRLQRPPFTGRLEVIESRLATRLLALSIPPWGVPTMVNNFVSRTLLHQMLSVYADVFTGAAPDQSFCMHTLDSVEQYHYLDVPLMIAYGIKWSNGHAVGTGRANVASREFVGNLMSKGGLTFAPIPDVMANHNVIINEYCRLKAVQRSGRFVDLDLARYCYRLDLELAEQGKDLQHPDRRRVEAFRLQHGLPRIAPSITAQLGLAVRSGPAKRIAQTASDRLGVNPTNRPIGRFGSVLEALSYEEDHPPRPNSSASGFLRGSDRAEAKAAGVTVR